MVTVVFFNDTATTEIFTLCLHDALPILLSAVLRAVTLCVVPGETPANVGDSWKVPPSRLYSNPAPTGAVITMVAVGIAHVGWIVLDAVDSAGTPVTPLTVSVVAADTQVL